MARYRALPTLSEARSPTVYLDDSEPQIFQPCSRQVLSPDSFYVHPDYPIIFIRAERAVNLVQMNGARDRSARRSG